MKDILRLATPLTMGSFVLMSVTGVLMFFHLHSGLNKAAHEWLSWIFLIGVGIHIIRNLPSFKRHLKSRLGAGMMIVFAAILLASTLITPDSAPRPPVREIVTQLSQTPFESLAIVAGISPETLKERLNIQGIHFADESQSLNDVTNGDQTKTMKALNAVFTK